MKISSFVYIAGFLALSLLGAGCSGFRSGNVPTTKQLHAMNDTTWRKAIKDRDALVPRVEPTKEEQEKAASAMREIVGTGTPERVANFVRAFDEVSGSARLVHLGNKWYVALSDDFSVVAGPDQHVFISQNLAPTTRGALGADDIDAGAILSSHGGQTYELPNEFDVTNAKSVVIYSPTFEAVYGVAAFR